MYCITAVLENRKYMILLEGYQHKLKKLQALLQAPTSVPVPKREGLTENIFMPVAMEFPFKMICSERILEQVRKNESRYFIMLDILMFSCRLIYCNNYPMNITSLQSSGIFPLQSISFLINKRVLAY